MMENETIETTTIEPIMPVVETPAQINYRELRKQLEAEEKARKAAENRAEQLAAQYKNQAPAEDDDFVDEDKKKIEYLEQRLNALEVEQVTTRMTDFNERVTDENLDILRRLYPDEHASLMYNPSVRSRAKAAYNMLEKYGIIEDKTRKAHDKIEENKKKPVSASVVAPQSSPTPLSNLDQYGRRTLSDEDRDKVMKEAARKRRMS